MAGRTVLSRLIGALALALLGAPGCVTSQYELSAVSTKQIELTALTVDPAKLRGRGVGESCYHKIFMVSWGSAVLVEAISRALEAKQGDLLLNAVVTYHWYEIPIAYDNECYRVEGEVVDTQ